MIYTNGEYPRPRLPLLLLVLPRPSQRPAVVILFRRRKTLQSSNSSRLKWAEQNNRSEGSRYWLIGWLIDLTCFSRSAASLCTRWKLFKACTKLFKNQNVKKSQAHLCELILQPLPLKLCSTIQYLGVIQHWFRTYSASNKLSQPVHLQVVSIVLRCLWQVDQCSVATASTGPSTPHPGN